ncbi:MAG: DNA-binding response OmpR family regulator [Myxococcota bacterium]
MKRHILVAEDDAAIRTGLCDALEFSGYAVHQAADGDAALTKATDLSLDLVVLDLVMPKRHGLDVLAAVRRARPALPVIILTAMGGEADRVSGLRLGADDYVVKPFSVMELLARIEAVLRRSAERATVPGLGPMSLPSGSLNLADGELTYLDGTTATFTERELEVLGYLVRHAGRIVSRDELLERIWRVDPRRFETRTVDVCVGRIRSKLRDDPKQPTMLGTIRGKGYRLTLPDAGGGS